jgi:chitinase
MHYVQQLGAPKNKLVLGVPFFGGTFTLEDETDPGSPSTGSGDEGYYTTERGFLAYFEICNGIIQNNWNVDRDQGGNVYAYKGDQWVGFDSVDSVARKVYFIGFFLQECQ